MGIKKMLHCILLGSVTFNLTSIWTRIVDPKLQIPELEVTFENGVKQKIILNHYNGMPNSKIMDPSKLCNYIGYLENDKDSRVAFTGCLSETSGDKKAYITLLSKDSLYRKSFSLDRFGISKEMKTNDYDTNINDEISSKPQEEAVLEDRDVHVDDWKTYGNVRYWKKKEKKVESVSEKKMASVPYNLNVNFRFGYDNGTKNWMDENNENIDNWLATVMTHLQLHFSHSSLEHYIFLNVSLSFVKKN